MDEIQIKKNDFELLKLASSRYFKILTLWNEFIKQMNVKEDEVDAFNQMIKDLIEPEKKPESPTV